MLGWWGLLSRYGGCDDTAGSERSTGWLASWMVRRLVGWLAGKGVASWRRRCRRSKRESVPRKGAFSRRASLPEDTYTPVDTRLSNRTPLPSSVAICLLPARGTHQCVTNWMDSSWEVTSPSLLFLFLFFSFFFNFFVSSSLRVCLRVRERVGGNGKVGDKWMELQLLEQIVNGGILRACKLSRRVHSFVTTSPSYRATILVNLPAKSGRT